MSLAAVEDGQREFSFSDQDFQSLARLARAEFGLSLAESKKPLVYSRLARRLRAREVGSFQQYLTLLETADESEERLELISALTTNVTSFFREKHHFETLKSELSPDFGKTGKARIWSAGCSSGQEPFSIALTLLETIPDAARRDIRILATDIDPAVVSRAKRGRYSNEEKTAIAPALQSKWTRLCPDAPSAFEFNEEIRKMISFGELNLMVGWPFKGPFDAIFCRNVAIYFDHETQQKLWSKFADKLRPGGYLFIGHSERVTGPAMDGFTTAGVTTYRKIAGSGSALEN